MLLAYIMEKSSLFEILDKTHCTYQIKSKKNLVLRIVFKALKADKEICKIKQKECVKICAIHALFEIQMRRGKEFILIIKIK